jgi:hypothetical protein
MTSAVTTTSCISGCKSVSDREVPPVPFVVPPAQETDLTSERNETQYCLAIRGAEALSAALSERLPKCQYAGSAAGWLEHRQFITTVYFDTPSRALYRERAEGMEDLRLRARQYYGSSLSPSGTLPDAGELVTPAAVLWFEIKHKLGIRSAKRRIGIPHWEVPGFFGAGPITAERIRRQPVYLGEPAQLLQEVAEICERYREPFWADAVVNFRRVAWQDMRAALRVTLDLDLAFFPPPRDLWTGTFSLTRERLGPPLHRDSRCVLEVKTRATPPDWLLEVLAAAGAEPRIYSKFEEASRAVHG